MQKLICSVCGLFGAAAALAAAPELVGLASVQSREAEVKTTFSLQGEAILTVDVKTNGVSIGWRNFRSAMKGAVLNRVNPAGDYTLTWNPSDSWTDVGPKLSAGTVSLEVTAWSPDDPPMFMDVDLAADKSVAYYCDADDLPVPVTDDLYKTTHLLMRRIPAANKTFLMGSPSGEDRRSVRPAGDADGREEHQHPVSLSHDYYMGVYELTQGQYFTLKGASVDGQSAVGDRYPVANITYESVRYFWKNLWPRDGHELYGADWLLLNVMRNKTGVLFDLPTEAQWEFACRAGTTSAYCDGTSSTATLGNYAVFKGNAPKDGSGNVTCAEVGTKSPNGFGLYDMVGNVSEYCVEQRTTYALGHVTDPKGKLLTENMDLVKIANRGSNYSQGDSSDWDWSDPYGVAIIEHRSAFRGEYWCSAKAASPTRGVRLVAPVSRQWPTVAVAAGTVAQDSSRRVAITYELASDAIVTLELYKDGERVSDEALRAICGDVNRLVKADGQAKCIYWTPDASWPRQVLAAGHLSFKVHQWAPTDPPAYMVLDLTQSQVDTRAYYASAEAMPEPITNDVWKTDYLVMRRIPAKDVVWQMGISTNAAGQSVEDVGYDPNISKPHRVRLSQDYYMSVFELTCRQLRVTGDDVSKDANRANWTKPYSDKWLSLRWDGGAGYNWPAKGHQVFSNTGIDKFRKRFNLQFDYPTEAQWEYACRAGTDGRHHGYANPNDCAWYSGNSGSALHPVGEKLPNAWGLYDMLGNAFEYCLDGNSGTYGLTNEQLASITVDPYGTYPLADNNKIMRGGSCTKAGYECRSGDRSVSNNWDSNWGTTGFRLVCPLPGETFAEPVLP